MEAESSVRVNEHFVGVRGDKILILKPAMGEMSREEALELAAWIVALADPLGARFQAILAEVCNT